MGTTRIKTGQEETIRAKILNSDNRPLVGLTDVFLSISRKSDGKFLDFDDNTFKSSGWTNRTVIMTEVVPSPQPSDITGDTDGSTGVITGMTDTSDFSVGDYAASSDGFPASNVAYRITAVTATTITIDINSDSAENNVTVTGYHNPAVYEYDFDTSVIVSPVANDQFYFEADSESGTGPLSGELKSGDVMDDFQLIKGLLGVNCVLDDFSYDSKRKATLGNIYVYNSAANANLHDGTGLLLRVNGVAAISPSWNTTKLTRVEA